MNGYARVLCECLVRWGEVDPPMIIMPPDSRAIKAHLPFQFDTLREVQAGGCDHKSGYQQVALTQASQCIEWHCWYLVYTTLSFGFKASCYIYHSICLAVVSHARNLIYIDDSLVRDCTLQASTNYNPRRHLATSPEQPGGLCTS